MNLSILCLFLDNIENIDNIGKEIRDSLWLAIN